MQNMRDLLRGALGKSLASLPESDRLAAAWPVACGPALASRGCIVGFAGQTLDIEVEDRPWLVQFQSMAPMLERELARIAGVRVAAIHFHLRRDPR